MRSIFHKIWAWLIPKFSALRRFKDWFISKLPALGKFNRKVVPKLSNLWRRVVSIRIPLGVVALVGSLIALIYWGPEWHVERLGISRGSENFAELANKYRATYAQIIGGVLFLSGLYFAWKRLEVARESQDIDRQNQLIIQEGQITERFTRAVDQLGNESLVIRLGGIYALERIARDSKKDHWTVMEVLTAYVRTRSPWSEEKAKEEPNPLPTDIQAVLTVIGRRKWIENETQRPDLRRTNLRKADFSQSHPGRVNLNGAHLEGANLSGAHLEGVALIGAHLEFANISGGANLKGALLFDAHLQGADLSGAHLEGVNLRGARGLTMEQIDSAITDKRTQLPDYLKKPPEKEQK